MLYHMQPYSYSCYFII